jgi:hypothetical protein
MSFSLQTDDLDQLILLIIGELTLKMTDFLWTQICRVDTSIQGPQTVFADK